MPLIDNVTNCWCIILQFADIEPSSINSSVGKWAVWFCQLDCCCRPRSITKNSDEKIAEMIMASNMEKATTKEGIETKNSHDIDGKTDDCNEMNLEIIIADDAEEVP